MSDVKALFGLIDKKNKRRLIGAVICCVLSVLCGILPYLGVWGIVTCFLNERTENLFQYVCLIAVAIILKHPDIIHHGILKKIYFLKNDTHMTHQITML